MKKLLCTILTLFIVLSSFIAYANTDFLFDAWLKEIRSADAKLEMSFKLNRPLEFMSELTKNDEYIDESSNALVEGLVGSLLNTGASWDMSCNVSDDNKVIKAAAEMQLNVPIEASDSFKADIWAKFGFWTDIDLTDESNPLFNVIFKVPFTDKYYVADYTQMPDSEAVSMDAFAEYMAKYTDKEFVNEYNTFLKELVQKYMTVASKGSGVYELTADDKAFKAMLREGSVKFIDIFNDAMALYGFEAESDVDYQQEIDAVFGTIDTIQILGSEGFKGTVVIENGYVNLTDFALHICVNISDIASAMSQDMTEFDREKLWIDVTMYTKASYENINKDVKVVFPELNEENSINVFDMYDYEDQYYEDDYYEDYISPWFYVSEEGAPVVINNELYMPLRASMIEFGVDPENISVNNGEIVVSAEDIGILEFTEIKFTEFSNVVYINGQSVTLDNAVIEQNGKAYFPKQLMTYLNCTPENVTYYMNDTPTYYIEYYREWYGYDEY